MDMKQWILLEGSFNVENESVTSTLLGCSTIFNLSVRLENLIISPLPHVYLPVAKVKKLTKSAGKMKLCFNLQNACMRGESKRFDISFLFKIVDNRKKSCSKVNNSPLNSNYFSYQSHISQILYTFRKPMFTSTCKL